MNRPAPSEFKAFKLDSAGMGLLRLRRSGNQVAGATLLCVYS